jgi:D-amino peptidase
MKIYISVDMEGIAGIVHVDQTRPDGQDYRVGRELMTAETNAAALGAFDAGAKEVLVNDSHGDMRNLLFDRLDPRVQVISGSLKPYSMVQGTEMRHDAALFVGYHAGMGARAGILDHTYSGASVSEVSVNGRALNETGLNALVAGAHGTPVALVTGDDRVCAEVRELLGEVETVAVKWGISRYCARSLHPAEACRQIREASKRAVEGRARFRPFRMDPPYRLRIRFLNAGMADGAGVMPGTDRVDGTTVEFRTQDVFELFRAMLAMTRLGDQAIPQVRAK